jgi:hypothetical protein
MPCICNEKLPIKQGAMDRFFLLDNVRHISRNLKSQRFVYEMKTPIKTGGNG